jgi:hypothetical protein
MLTQRLETTVPAQSGTLIITAEPGALAELEGLADELNLRSNIRTEGTIHHLNDPAGNGDPNPTIV